MEDLSSELDPALLSTPASSSSPPSSASPSRSSSFYHPSPPQSPAAAAALPPAHTLTVTNLSCTPRARGAAAPFARIFRGGSGGGGARLLTSVSFTARSAEMLAVVGPSGAGKSTLLRVLSGRGGAPAASVAVDGRAVAGRAGLRRLCSFVTQDDNLLPLLTVRETLLFAARFRLGDAVPAGERRERVDALMRDLGLGGVADSYVGDAEARGISGGERKRVAIAADAIHGPPVLLLDEPTSGLDSRSALHVLELLHAMACKRQQVIILSIHQPSYRMLHYMASVLLLSHGSVAHFGSLRSLEEAMSRLGYGVPAQLNPLELAIEVAEELAKAAAMDRSHGEQRSVGRGAEREVLVRELDKELEQGYCGRVEEVAALSVRFWRMMSRTRELFMARAAQAVVGGLGLGSVFFRVRRDEDGLALRLGLFAFSLSFLLSSTVEALPIFLRERRVLMREASRRMYRLSSYLVANTLVVLPFLLAVALLFSAPVYWLAGLDPAPAAFAFFVFTVWLIVLMASSLVLFLSAVSPDFVLGNSLICVSLGVFFLFSGYFIPKESIPKYWAFMYYVSLYRYPLDVLLINEYGSERNRCVSWLDGEGSVCLRSGGDVLRARGLDEGMKWVNVGVMCGFFLLYRVLCWAILVRRASKTTL